MSVYVIYTMAGNEHKVEKALGERVLLENEEVYVPLYEREQIWHGEKRIVTSVLFPGYVFYDTGRGSQDLRQRLRKVWGLTRILGAENKAIPLHEEEVRFIYKLCGKGHVLDVSTAYLEGDKAKVIQGPLRGMDSCIVRVNRKKRTAVIRVKLLGRETDVEVGLDIIQ